MIRIALLLCFCAATAEAAPTKKSARHHARVRRIAYRPEIQLARARAGYPFWQTTANVTGFATGWPIGLLFRILK